MLQQRIFCEIRIIGTIGQSGTKQKCLVNFGNNTFCLNTKVVVTTL